MVMLASSEDDKHDGGHPFWYAQVLAILHVKARRRGGKTDSKRIDILWVRWLGLDPNEPNGVDCNKLDKVGFVEESADSPAFGFIDPKDVVRAVHLIPSFVDGWDVLAGRDTTSRLMSRPSIVQSRQREWSFFWVNR
jgi:hypothetical protein